MKMFNSIRPFVENRKFHIISILIISGIIIFYNLGRNSFHNGDESMYALVVKDIFRTGDWLNLHLEGEKYLVKPPLMIWLSALSSKVFGFSEFSVRFPSAFFGVLTIVFTYLFAERLFDKRTAILSALMILTCTQFIYVHSAKTGEFDTSITFFILISGYFAFKSRSEKKYFYLTFLSIGLVAMIKSVVFVIPMSAFIISVLLSGKIRNYRPGDWIIGFGIFFIVILPWHLTQIINHGKMFLDIYLLDQVIGRKVGGGKPIGLVNPLYYIKVILRGWFPWSILVPFAVTYNILDMKKAVKDKIILVFTWILAIFLIANLIAAKYGKDILTHWYILPIYPFLSLLVGRFLVKMLESFKNRKLFFLILIGIIIPLSFMVPDRQYNPFAERAYKSIITFNLNNNLLRVYRKSPKLSIAAFFFLWIALSMTAYFLLRRSEKYAIVSKATVSILLFYLFIVGFLSIIQPLRFSDYKSSFNIMNREIWSLSGPETVLVYYGNNLPNYKDRIYFSNFKIPEKDTVKIIVLDEDLLLNEMLSKEKRFFFMEKQHYNDIRIKERFKPIIDQPTRRWNNYVLLSNWEQSHSMNGNEAQFSDSEGKDSQFLIDFLDSSDGEIVSKAAKTLSDLRCFEAVDSLKNALKRYDEDDNTFQTIALALAYLRDRDSSKFLTEKYIKNPIYPNNEAIIPNPPEYGGHNRFWTTYLLIDIDPLLAQDIITENILDYVQQFQSQGRALSIYDRPLYQIYRLGNRYVMDLAEKLLLESDILLRRIALYLLSKPPSLITKMTEQETMRAQFLLQQNAENDGSSENRILAGEILEAYHPEAWVGW